MLYLIKLVNFELIYNLRPELYDNPDEGGAGMDPLKTGKLIRKKRLGLSMTQLELADRVFVGKATVSAWETGKTYPNMQSQMLLYKVLGVNPLELMTGRVMRDHQLKKDVEDFIMQNTDTIVGFTEDGERIEFPADGWFIAATDDKRHMTGEFKPFDWDTLEPVEQD